MHYCSWSDAFDRGGTFVPDHLQLQQTVAHFRSVDDSECKFLVWLYLNFFGPLLRNSGGSIVFTYHRHDGWWTDAVERHDLGKL